MHVITRPGPKYLHAPPCCSPFLWLEQKLPESCWRSRVADGSANDQPGSLTNWGKQSPCRPDTPSLDYSVRKKTLLSPLQFGSICYSSLPALPNMFVILISLPQATFLCHKNLWLTWHLVPGLIFLPYHNLARPHKPGYRARDSESPSLPPTGCSEFGRNDSILASLSCQLLCRFMYSTSTKLKINTRALKQSLFYSILNVTSSS